ncbi:MAG: hypothetical protein PUB93_03655 [Firmicutes bacterium]|nr:hypothetical protein [Bacillota bacterium]
MIIFIGGFEIVCVLVILIAITAGSAEMITNMIGVFIAIFAIKNFVQTVILGYFKNKNPLSTMIGFLAIDSVRMVIFFTNLQKIGTAFVNATGLRYFTNLLGFILYFLICGSIFLFGEFVSLMQSLGNKRSEQREINKFALIGGVATVIVLAFVSWLGYQ